MITYKDWLNGVICERIEGDKLLSLEDQLHKARSSGLLSQTEFDKITTDQLETWENAIELNFQKWVQYIRQHSDSKFASDNDVFIEYEKELINSEISQNVKPGINIGHIKPILNISGQDYSEIKLLMPLGVETYFELNIPEKDQLSFRLHLAKKKMKYLQGLNLNKKQVKSFPDYLQTNDRLQLAAKLKNEFAGEKGKVLRLMIEVLQLYNLISTGNRKRKAIHDSLRSFFDRDIASYNAFNFKYDPEVDQIDFDSVKSRMNYILESISKTK